MELIDVLGRENWQKMLEEISEEYGVEALLLDEEAAVVIRTGLLNPLCTALREKPENRTFICAQSARGMTGEIRESLQPINDFCDGGMKRFAVPVVRGGKFIGQVVVCGIITDPDEIMPELLAQQMDAPVEEVKRLIEKVKQVDDAVVDRLIREIVERVAE
jgi:ligand-binding sensor protein